MEKKTIKWHPATESPGTKRFVGAFIKKGRSEDQLTFKVIRYFQHGVVPCESCEEEDDELCVAWTDYKELIKDITPTMIANAKCGAWGSWKEE